MFKCNAFITHILNCYLSHFNKIFVSILSLRYIHMFQISIALDFGRYLKILRT
nr:MAG TPA: hypothetical protein [Caudoviricetes sp.]